MCWLAAPTVIRAAMDAQRLHNEMKVHEKAMQQLMEAELMAQSLGPHPTPYEMAQALAKLKPDAMKALADAY